LEPIVLGSDITNATTHGSTNAALPSVYAMTVLSRDKPAAPMRIYTIGHSTHPFREFVELLHARRIDQLADVRAHPGSRRLPWFNRDVLAKELPVHRCAYVHLPQLGGRRRSSADGPNQGWHVAPFRGYADHMSTPEFAAGLQALEALAADRTTAVMCAEGLWWRCHRRLIADALTTRGWRVVHIGPRGEMTEHQVTPFADTSSGAITYPRQPSRQ
jgi:uncharacterized protein (DUF488 family)